MSNKQEWTFTSCAPYPKVRQLAHGLKDGDYASICKAADMMADGMYDNTPMLEQAAAQVASSLNITASANRAVVGSGSSPYGDMVNGMLQGITAINNGSSEDQKDIVLEIDGQQFARLIMPKLNKEYKRNGIALREV